MPNSISHQSRRNFLRGGVSLWLIAGLGVTNRPMRAVAAPIPKYGDKGQQDWRFCNKCFILYYDGYHKDNQPKDANRGRCPAGGAHFPQGWNFELPFNTRPEGDTQEKWRFCDKCSSMFYDGYEPKTGACPAGGGHHAAGYNFVLHHDTAATLISQDSWRFCDRCFGMYYDGYAQKGTCPAGGGHHPNGHIFVLSHERPPNMPPPGGLKTTIPGDTGDTTPWCVSDCSACTAAGKKCTNSLACSPASPAPWQCN